MTNICIEEQLVPKRRKNGNCCERGTGLEEMTGTHQTWPNCHIWTQIREQATIATYTRGETNRESMDSF